MTGFDYAVLVIIGISVLLSMMRGFVREVLALVSWVVAFIVAKLYTLEVAAMLPDSIPNEELKFLAAFLILFLSSLLVCSLLAIAIAQIFKSVGLGSLDRALGGLFGFARGMLVVLTLVLLGGLTTFPQDPRWQNAMFSAPLEAVVANILPWFPQDIAKHIKYD
ncbi:membrane protein required for colicin V production [Methylobacillus rhizosphaerae]|uniref:Membrane protein required for colicin V production n=1 Tax=Methylobacillus rhizosphaerae TaxID=551994 RepID=A0A238YJ11_9PROT|nr:CvpA family protein [Methylobacillus rhizosphaerae]SNR70603.1 membrane protein required for colicin V production [Methylobacillus rhizosphaerae]